MTVKSPTPFLAFLLLAFGCPDSFAGKPDSHSLGYFDLLEVVDCGDYSVMDDARVFAHIRDFADSEGNIERSQIHLTATDDFYRNNDPNGTRVTGKTRSNDRAFFDDTGEPLWEPEAILSAVRISGAGALVLDVGVLDVGPHGWEVDFAADRFNGWAAADFDAVCAHFD